MATAGLVLGSPCGWSPGLSQCHALALVNGGPCWLVAVMQKPLGHNTVGWSPRPQLTVATKQRLLLGWGSGGSLRKKAVEPLASAGAYSATKPHHGCSHTHTLWSSEKRDIGQERPQAGGALVTVSAVWKGTAAQESNTRDLGMNRLGPSLITQLFHKGLTWLSSICLSWLSQTPPALSVETASPRGLQLHPASLLLSLNQWGHQAKSSWGRTAAFDQTKQQGDRLGCSPQPGWGRSKEFKRCSETSRRGRASVWSRPSFASWQRQPLSQN